MRAGWRSFTWHKVPFNDTDCLLKTPVTHPFLKLEVHRLLGGFTQKGSPILYRLRISLRPGGHNPLDSNPVAVDRIGWCTCNRHIILWCHIISIHRLCNCTLLSGGDPFYTSMTLHHHAIATWHMRVSQSELDPHSFWKHSNCLLRKAVSLSVRISSDGPHS